MINKVFIPVPLQNKDQIDYKDQLYTVLEGLIGDHERLTNALKQFQSILQKEDTPHSSQTIYQHCKKELLALKTLKQIDADEFEEVTDILNVLSFYIHMKPISPSAFFSIFNQELNRILQDIETGFRFTDNKSHQQNIVDTTIKMQQLQNKLKLEHPQPSSIPFWMRTNTQLTFGILEITSATLINMLIAPKMSTAFSSMIALFAPPAIFLGAEVISFLMNARSLATNLIWSLSTRERSDLSEITEINIPVDLVQHSYGNMAEQLHNTANQQNIVITNTPTLAEIIVIPENRSATPAPQGATEELLIENNSFSVK